MVGKESSLVKALEAAVAKSEAADYKVKYDVLHTACKRILRENRPLPPITDWRNGHLNGEETQAKD